MSDVIVDCAELFKNPIRTGIQRVVRELLRFWPENGPELHLARFEGEGLQRLPREILPFLVEREPATRYMSLEERQRHLWSYASGSNESLLPTTALVLVPELFHDINRCHYYE